MSTRVPRRKSQRRTTAPHRPPAEGRCPASGKKCWPRREARQLVKRLRAGGDPEARRLSIYRCDACQKWHVGHRRTQRAA